MIVLDASAAVDLLLSAGASAGIRQRLVGETLHVPHLFDAEVLQGMRRAALRGRLAQERAGETLADLAELPVVRYPHRPLLARAWDLRHNVTAFDALYVALAEALDAPLITADAPLARAIGHRARVEVYRSA